MQLAVCKTVWNGRHEVRVFLFNHSEQIVRGLSRLFCSNLVVFFTLKLPHCHGGHMKNDKRKQIEDTCLLGCDAVTLGYQLPTFRHFVMFSSAASSRLRLAPSKRQQLLVHRSQCHLLTTGLFNNIAMKTSNPTADSKRRSNIKSV
jgi:hypothetical protein